MHHRHELPLLQHADLRCEHIQLEHVQRHGHALHVLRALRACPLASTASGSKPHAEARRSRRCCLTRPPASRPTPRPLSSALPSTRQNAAAFNQALTFDDTSKVTDMSYMFQVRSARAPWLQHSPVLNPTLKRAARAFAASYALPPPEPHLAAQRLPSLRLGSARRSSTSLLILTRPASRTCATCSTRRRSTSR